MKRCRACLTENSNRRLLCQACGKRLPKRRKSHNDVLKVLTLSDFVAANDSYDGCWICRFLGVQFAGKPQRDHWHNGPRKGEPRGVLCPYHNRKLGPDYTPELLAAYLAYVTRAA